MDFSEQDFLEICKAKIEEKFHLGNGDRRLKQRDFEYLIDVIEEVSGIKLSVSTLKRLWREKGEQNPHPTTLDALVSILECKDWLDFKVNVASEAKTIRPKIADTAREQQTGKPVLIAIVAVAVFAVLIVSVTTFNSPGPADTENVQFSVSNTVEEGLPTTVIFNYNLSGVDAETFYIQQDWNPENRQEIDRDGGFFTTVYYYPGFHRARILADETVLKTEDVFVRTGGWLAAAVHRDDEEHPVYLPAYITDNHMLSIREQDLLENGVDPGRYSGSGIFNIGNFGDLDAHNFVAETRFKNRPLLNVPCPFAQFTIHTEANIYFTQFTSMGCVGELQQKIGEQFFSGNDNDLSAFGAELAGWQELSITVENKVATVLLNGEQIFETQFEDDFGRVVGVDYRFSGMGDVDYLRFRDHTRALVFEDDF